MKNILYILFSLIILAPFVVPGEARAWSTAYTPAPSVFSEMYGTTNGSTSWCGSASCPRNVWTEYYPMLLDGTANQHLVPGSVITVDPTFQVTSFEIFPGARKYHYGNCTTANTGGDIYSTRAGNPATRPTYCVGTPFPLLSSYAYTYSYVLDPDPGAWGCTYQPDTVNYYWQNGVYVRALCAFVVGITSVSPTPTITSSDNAIVSCSSGTSCVALRNGSATLTVSYPVTTAKEYMPKITDDYIFGCCYDQRSAVVPATSVDIPVTVGAVANQQPTAVIATPVANPISITQGDSLLFTGTGTDPDGTVTNYEWTYGGCGVSGTHLAWGSTYNANTLPVGTYTLSLRVQDNSGDWSPSCDTRTLTVNAPVPCSVLAGTSCTSAVNACGSNTGTYQCDGSCSATPPAIPVNYGNACTSATSACGTTNAGTILCSGSCSASVPLDSSCPAAPAATGCNNNLFCESGRGENPLNCPTDCKVKYQQF